MQSTNRNGFAVLLSLILLTGLTTLSLTLWRSTQLMEDLLFNHLKTIEQQSCAMLYFEGAARYAREHFQALLHVLKEGGDGCVCRGKLVGERGGYLGDYFAKLTFSLWRNAQYKTQSVLILIELYKSSHVMVRVQGVLSATDQEKPIYLVHHITFSPHS